MRKRDFSRLGKYGIMTKIADLKNKKKVNRLDRETAMQWAHDVTILINDKLEEFTQIQGNNIDSYKSETQNVWTAALLYVSAALQQSETRWLRGDLAYYSSFNPSGIQHNPRAYDLHKVSILIDLYIAKCLQYDKAVTIVGFSALSGIPNVTLQGWHSYNGVVADADAEVIDDDTTTPADDGIAADDDTNSNSTPHNNIYYNRDINVTLTTDINIGYKRKLGTSIDKGDVPLIESIDGYSKLNPYNPKRDNKNNNSYNNKIYYSRYKDKAKKIMDKLFSYREHSLINMMVTGKRNPVGLLATLNHFHGWENAVRQPDDGTSRKAKTNAQIAAEIGLQLPEGKDTTEGN